MRKLDPILQPFTINNLTLKNRIVSTSHSPNYVEDGKPKLRYQLYHEEKAKGGIGMTMFGGSSIISLDTPSVFGQINLSNDDVIPYFEQFSNRIHKHDCGLICQISHLGNRTTWKAGNWLTVMAPSRVKEPMHRSIPKVMDAHDISRVVEDYAAAAERCFRGGLDGVEVLAHGHLPGQFLSKATNKRTDEYGGTLENRMRFTIQVLEHVREKVGRDFVLGVRFGASEAWSKGYDLSEGIEAAQMVAEAGFVDYMTVNFGHIESYDGLAKHMPGMWSGFGPWAEQLRKFRRYVHIPLIHACRIVDVSTARYMLSEDLVDLVGMTRAHVADPHIVRKVMEGRESEIRPCVGANYCVDRVSLGLDMLCIHNVATGREQYIPQNIHKTEGDRRHVVVVGGGPAGLEAARVSAERGHRVTLLEATDRLGGQIQLAARCKWRRDLTGIVDWYERSLGRLHVDVRFNSLAGADDVRSLSPDIVVVATGGVPATDVTDSTDGAACVTSTWEAMTDKRISGRVIIYDDGDGAGALTCADYLSDQTGVELEFITPDRAVGYGLGPQNFSVFLEHLYGKGVRIQPDYRLSSVLRQPDGTLLARFSSEYDGPPIERVVDTVVVENGTIPLTDVYDACRSCSMNDGIIDQSALVDGTAQKAVEGAGGEFMLYRVGDAVSSRNIHAAIYDSRRLCRVF